MKRTLWLLGAVLALGSLAVGTSAQADGYPPFYGYSPYFGGPAIYYTHETDVQQATTFRGGEPGFGVRTYTRGGPFWGYQPSGARRTVAAGRGRYARRAPVLRRKG